MNEDREGSINLNEYLRIILRGRWIILISFLFILGTTTYFTYKMEPVYQASTTIMIEDKARLEQSATQELLDDLIGSGLLRTGSTGRIAFSHPYCQDYFAGVALQGEYARGSIDWDNLIKKYEWREAIHFLVSIVNRPADLISQLSDHDPLLAAECLLEAEVVDDELRGQVLRAIADRETAGDGSQKTRAIELLTELRSAGIIPDDVPYRSVESAIY